MRLSSRKPLYETLNPKPQIPNLQRQMSVDWGICQGHYETKLCGTSQSEVDTAMRTIASSYTELHPEVSAVDLES
jgi:hypothetical protein